MKKNSKNQKVLMNISTKNYRDLFQYGRSKSQIFSDVFFNSSRKISSFPKHKQTYELMSKHMNTLNYGVALLL